MANTTLHWQLREALDQLKTEYRLNVLISYILHGNERNRSWVSVDTIAKETGVGTTAVIAAKKWLIACGALEVVPMDKRVGKEAEQHHRIDVMQVTGVLNLDAMTYPVLYFNEYQNTSLYTSPAETTPSETSADETSPAVATPADTEDIEVYTDHDQDSETPIWNNLQSSPTADLELLELARADVRTPFAMWEDEGYGPLTQFTGQRLGDWVDTYGEESVKVALLSGVMNDVRKASYVSAALRRMFGEQTSREIREEIARKKGWEKAAEDSARDEELRKALYAPAASEPAAPLPLMANGRHPHSVWESAYGQLQLQVPREAFDTWLRHARLIAFEDHGGVAIFTLGVPHVQAREWLKHRLMKPILRTLSQIAGCAVTVRFVVASEHEVNGGNHGEN